jgi:hypothetical protein
MTTKNETPRCRGCMYMRQGIRAKANGNNDTKAGPRAPCHCTHPRHRETFEKVCPRSPRMPGFIAYTECGKNGPNIKTSPRWCPLRNENKWCSAPEENEKEAQA